MYFCSQKIAQIKNVENRKFLHKLPFNRYFKLRYIYYKIKNNKNL